ncbi:MAG: Calx-beta domain-containing protein, partial [Crocosphaera sp.]|nr:Calx-beta domain-containing protein [Crocosphaera sp.]
MNNTYVQFSSANYSGFEKDQPYPNQIEITVVRSGNLYDYSSVEVHLGNTTAQQWSDFDGIFPQVVDFQPGETSKTITLDIFDDSDFEGTENIELKLINDSGNPELVLGE